MKVGKKREAESSGDWLTWSMTLGTFVGVSLLALVYLCQYAVLVRTHYKVVGLQERGRTLERERAVCELELQSLSSLERVERVAIKKLGMAPPQARQVLDLRKIQASGQVSLGGVDKN
jgi:cell division protein FtsL